MKTRRLSMSPSYSDLCPSTSSQSDAGWSANDFSARMGISRRALRQLRDLRGIDAPIGNGRAAKYFTSHEDQAKAVLRLMECEQVSMPKAVATLAGECTLARKKSMSRTSRTQVLNACVRGAITKLCDNVYLVVDAAVVSEKEKALIAEVKRTAAVFMSVSRRLDQKKQGYSVARVHRIAR